MQTTHLVLFCQVFAKKVTRKELVESYVTVYSDMKNKRTNTQNLDAKVVSERKSFSSLTFIKELLKSCICICYKLQLSTLF